MLLIHCPYCDKTLPELEFAYAGEAHIERPGDPALLSDEEWRDFLFIRNNKRGPHFERWRHVHGCARYFNAVRDTVSDKFLTTYRAGEPRPDINELKELQRDVLTKDASSADVASADVASEDVASEDAASGDAANGNPLENDALKKGQP